MKRPPAERAGSSRMIPLIAGPPGVAVYMETGSSGGALARRHELSAFGRRGWAVPATNDERGESDGAAIDRDRSPGHGGNGHGAEGASGVDAGRGLAGPDS